MKTDISEEIKALTNELVRLRRDFHQYPELGLQEHRTAEVIERYLKDLGLSVISKVGRTGVVGLLQGGGPGKTLLIRADMDGLPIQEQNDAPYRSRNDGIMHACGHDGHMAILLTVARILSARRESLAGAVKFVFQPGEEGFGGARLMIEDGALENPKVDAALALHLFTWFPVGTVNIRGGPVMASMDHFTVKVHGKGGHAALPHQGVDAILMSAHAITALQGLISKETSPFSPLVVHVGTIKGGDAENIIAEQVELTGTVRCLDDGLRRLIPRSMDRILNGVISAFRGTYDFQYTEGYPMVVNDETMAALAREAASEVVGGARVLEAPQSMGSEDMAYFLQEVPGCLMFVGAARGDDAPHHSAHFDFDEDALAIGAETMVRAALNYLERT